MRTTTYRAPDKRRGYTGGEIAAILSRHDPEATLVVRVGWKGQPQQLIVIEDEIINRLHRVDDRINDVREDLVTRCETPAPEDMPTGLGPNLQRRIDGLPEYSGTPAPPLGIHRADQRLGEHGARGMVTFPGPINVVPSPSDLADIEGIARATEAEELVREELRAEGIDVAAVERAARRAQQRGLGGAR